MTVQPINPLIDRARPATSYRVTREMLEEMAERYNRQAWVRSKGWLYFVATNSQGLATLERNEGRG